MTAFGRLMGFFKGIIIGCVLAFVITCLMMLIFSYLFWYNIPVESVMTWSGTAGFYWRVWVIVIGIFGLIMADAEKDDT